MILSDLRSSMARLRRVLEDWRSAYVYYCKGLSSKGGRAALSLRPRAYCGTFVRVGPALRRPSATFGAVAQCVRH
jgi:hypothetical protein